MDQTSSQRKAILEVLPNRVAYFIPGESTDSFRRAVREASTRWAGVLEPIIPVTPTGRIAPRDAEFLERLDPNVAVAVDLSTRASSGVSKQCEMPVVPISGLDHLPSASVHPLNVGKLTSGAQLTLPSSEAVWEVAAAGDLSDASEADWDSSDATVHRARTADEVGRAQLDGSTVLEFGARHFGENLSGGGQQGPLLIHVMEPGSVKDAALFWNLRAISFSPFHANPILLPSDTDSWVGFQEQIAAFVRANASSKPAVTILSVSLSQDQRRDVARALGFRIERSTKWTLSASGHAAAEWLSPITASVDADPRQWLFQPRRFGQRSHTTAEITANQSTTLTFASPVPFHGGGIVRARIGGLTDSLVPQRPAVAQLFMDSATWRHGMLEFLTHPSSEYRYDLRVPLPDEILHAATGIQYETSEKGRYALALQQLVDPSELLRPGVFEVIHALTTPRSKQMRQTLERAKAGGADNAALLVLAAELGGRTLQPHRTASQLVRNPTLPVELVTDVLERLTSLGLAVRGLEIKCTNCGMLGFTELPKVEERASCPGCRSVQRYSVDRSGLKVVYRLNSLVDRASDNGVLGHLLAVGALGGQSPSCWLVPGANIVLPGPKKAELDLFGYLGDEVVAGEVKLSATGFTRVRRDVELSKLAGADTHVMASVDDLPADTRQRAEYWAKRYRIGLRVLAGETLRPS